MRVHIIGAGAVGMLMASYLSKMQLDVVLVTNTQQQAASLCTEQLTLIAPSGQSQRFAVDATDRLQAALGDLIVVAVKYQHLHSVYKQLEAFPELPVVFVQNGLAHFDEAFVLPHAQLFFASAQFGASKLDEVTVAHRGVGTLKLAAGRGNLSALASLLNGHMADFPIEAVQDAEQMLLEKALLNCFINPLTAILQVPNGELVTNPVAYKLLQRLYDELMVAFPTMRQQFPFALVQQLCEQTAHNTSSMLVDRLAGRQTEAYSIVGAVIERAAAPVPTLQLLYELLQSIDCTKERAVCY